MLDPARPRPESTRGAHNPFATRCVRPGAIGYRFPAGQSPESLLVQLEQLGWRAQIVGPHGSGKSTLLESLKPLLVQRGRQVEQFTLRQGQRRLPAAADPANWHSHTQVIVDGCEQLGWTARWRLRRACRHRGAGLLVTAHRPLGLPTLHLTRVDPLFAQQLAAELLAGSPVTITPGEVAAALNQRQGNLREAFFDLYDLYEQRLRDQQR